MTPRAPLGTEHLPLARRFVAAQAARYGTARPLWVALTGAHLYGFPSPDSDLDLKGVHAVETRDLLGLEPATPAVDHTEFFEGVECDLTTQELGKALDLLLRGNGNMLEQLTAPVQVVDGPLRAELLALLPGILSRRVAGHYRGFFRQKCRSAARGDRFSMKDLLYAWRVALTGVHLLRTGTVEADLRVLAEVYGHPEAAALAARKGEAAERATLSAAEAEVHVSAWPALESTLEQAVEDSALPERPTGRGPVEDWLRGVRVGML